MKKLLGRLIILVAVVASLAGGIVLAAPCVVNAGCTGQANVPLGASFYGSSTNQSLVVVPAGASSTVYTMIGSVPGWAVAQSGGSGNSAFLFGPGIIYNATSTDLVGIGTITPTTTLFVQGKGGTNPFTIASSTGVQLITVTHAGNVGIGTSTPNVPLHVVGSTTITSLNSALPVRSLTSGALINGSIALGGSDISGVLPIANGGTGTSTLLTFSLASITPGSNLTVTGNGSIIGSGTTTIDITATPTFTKVTTTNASATNFTLLNGFLLPGMANGCLQVTSGSATSTGVACGSGGGSGNSAFLFGNGLIYNATSTDLVGIGTTAPTTTLFVQGKSGTNPFAIASSTGVQMLTVTQAGSVGIGSSTPSGTFTLQSGAQALDFKFSGGAAEINTVSAGYTFRVNNVSVGGWSVAQFGTASNQFAVIDPNTGNTRFQVISADGTTTVGTSTPTSAMLFVTGFGKNLLTVGSSSGATFLQVTHAGNVGIGTSTPNVPLHVVGSTTITSLAVASCDVMATTFGNLYCGTNGAGSSILPFITNGTVAGVNATSSTVAFNVQGTTTLDSFNVSSSSGTSQLRVTQAGNVGIGTTSPTALFTVTRQSGFQQPVSGSTLQVVGLDGNPTRITIDTSNGASTSGNAIMFRRSRGTANAPAAVILDDVLGSLNFKGWGSTGFASTTALISSKAEGTSTDASMPTNLTFDTTATGTTVALERMRITGAGLIGIGTTAPIAMLSVQGSSTLPTTPLVSIASNTGATLFRINSNGSVGIGSSTPSGTFTMQSGTQALDFNLTGGGNTINSIGGGFSFRVSNTSVGGWSASQFGTSATLFAVVDPSTGQTKFQATAADGMTTIGTSTPTSAMLFVTGFAKNLVTVTSSSGATFLQVTHAGNVGIGTSTPSLPFVIASSTGVTFSVTSGGVIQQRNQINCTLGLTTDASGNVNGCVTSDERLKTNISPITKRSILNKVIAKFYDWKPAENKDTQRHGGFIAQEVQKVLPECVVSGGNGYLAVDPNCMVANLWVEVQNLPNVKRSVEENWQWLVMGLLCTYVLYNEIDKRRRK